MTASQSTCKAVCISNAPARRCGTNSIRGWIGILKPESACHSSRVKTQLHETTKKARSELARTLLEGLMHPFMNPFGGVSCLWTKPVPQREFILSFKTCSNPSDVDYCLRRHPGAQPTCCDRILIINFQSFAFGIWLRGPHWIGGIKRVSRKN